MGPLTDESGVARGVISLAENVTEAISERKKIDRMQSEFARARRESAAGLQLIIRGRNP